MKAVLCPVCNGKGKVKDEDSTANDSKKCYGCDGKGWVEVNESIPIYPTYPPTYPYPDTAPWFKCDNPWYGKNI